MRRELHPSSAFNRAMKRLARKDRRAFDAIRTTLAMLQDNAFDERLASHKLTMRGMSVETKTSVSRTLR